MPKGVNKSATILYMTSNNEWLRMMYQLIDERACRSIATLDALDAQMALLFAAVRRGRMQPSAKSHSHWTDQLLGCIHGETNSGAGCIAVGLRLRCAGC